MRLIQSLQPRSRTHEQNPSKCAWKKEDRSSFRAGRFLSLFSIPRHQPPLPPPPSSTMLRDDKEGNFTSEHFSILLAKAVAGASSQVLVPCASSGQTTRVTDVYPSFVLHQSRDTTRYSLPSSQKQDFRGTSGRRASCQLHNHGPYIQPYEKGPPKSKPHENL